MTAMEGLDANLNREKLKTTLVPMPRTLSPYQPASWISRHSQDGEKVVKQKSFFGSEEFKKTGEKVISPYYKDNPQPPLR